MSEDEDMFNRVSAKRVVLVYDGCTSLLVHHPVRDEYGRVIDGHVVNGNWRLKDVRQAAYYEREIPVPLDVTGDYNDVLNWSRNL